MPKRKESAWVKHVKAWMKKHPGVIFKEALVKAKLTYKKVIPAKAPAKAKPSKRKIKKMAKKKKKRRAFTLPMAPLIGLGSGFVIAPGPGWKSFIQGAQAGDWGAAYDALVANYLFYSVPENKFDIKYGIGTKLTFVGCGIHWLASKVGLNRFLGRARVPVLRV